MAIFKCKMCGGTIEFEPGATVGVCDSCGTKQTLPRLDDDKKANLYDRANHFRRNNDFDKAMAIYEQVLNEDPTDAEAYWSIVLCRYGIEYVEDPASHRRVPTVNRAQYTSIFSDEDYKSALQHADAYQKQIYEEEAHAIDEIQKGILEVSAKEEPFDVFICYKETDANGRRTQDSVLANDLYHQLVQEGFKVFFVRITLEDKLGTAYEPYIFAALNSAKVMVVLGTKPEYFNAVWVKNEWSRYLGLIKGGAKKTLIPAYRDMDPYDLPEEFSHLQAQDMSKLGFMQDLIRGIRKIATADEPKAAVKETVVVQSGGNSSTGALLERAFMFLEDGNWDSANEYCEKVLDAEPKNARAYLGKLMAELQVRTEDKLRDCAKPFSLSDNCVKACRFSPELNEKLNADIQFINDRNETERKTGVYNKAKEMMKSALDEFRYKDAADVFATVPGFKDADAMAQQCLEKAEDCRRKRLAKEEAERLEAERKAEERRIAAEKAAKKRKKVISIAAPIVAVGVALAILIPNVFIPNSNYNKAAALRDAGNYEEAIAAFEAMDGYKDSAEQIEACYIGKFGEEYWNYIKTIKAGDTYSFGSYEQDNNTSNGKETVEWIVLAKENNKILVVSKYALDCQPYNTSDTYVTWETCSLHTWLNGIFLNDAFSTAEQAKIATTNVSADKNPEYSTSPGNATTDKVFLLSITEAEKYFASDSARRCEPTAYAVANGAYKSKSGNGWWWLRSPGADQRDASYVDGGGSVRYGGRSVDDDYGCVRPALWINLE